MMNLWRRVAVFDLSCKQMSRDLLILSFKVQKWTELKGIQEKKAKARALLREAEGETARKSKSQPAAYRLKKKKVTAVVLKNEPHKYRYSRVSVIVALK